MNDMSHLRQGILKNQHFYSPPYVYIQDGDSSKAGTTVEYYVRLYHTLTYTRDYFFNITYLPNAIPVFDSSLSQISKYQ